MTINTEENPRAKRMGYLKLLLSHHPLCGFYEDHSYHMGKVDLCKGCTAGYSGIYLAIYLLVASALPAFLIINSIQYYFQIVFVAGLIVFVYELQPKRIIPRFPIRLIMGILFVVSIYTIFRLDNWFHKYLVALFIFVYANIIGLMRFKKLNAVCATNCGDRRLDFCQYALGLETPPELIALTTINSEVEQPYANIKPTTNNE